MLQVNQLIGFGAGGAGDIQYVGGITGRKTGTSDTTLSLTSLTGGIDSTARGGDLVVAAYGLGLDFGTPGDITSGYTEICNLFVSDTNALQFLVKYKVMTSTPDTTVTFGTTGASAENGMAKAVAVFRGVNATPLDVTSTTASSANSVLANPPSITPVTPGAWIVCVGGGGHNQGDGATFTNSELLNFITIGANGGSDDGLIGVGYKSDWTSGAFDPVAFGFSASNSTNYSWAAVSIALRPA